MTRRKINNQGFVLAMTLWFLAAISVAAGFFALWSGRAVETARLEGEAVQDRIDLAGTRASLFYLLTTQRLTQAGLVLPTVGATEEPPEAPPDPFSGNALKPIGNEVPLDGRVFQGLGSVRFSLQDEGGLIGLNAGGQPLENLLGLFGVPLDQRASLTDKLQDYIDPDDLHRLNGAEKADYAKLGLPAPANRRLLTPEEAKNVLGWDEYPVLWENDRLARMTTVQTTGFPNLNTAPEMVIQAACGLDEKTARRIVLARRHWVLSSLGDVFEAAGKKFPLQNTGPFGPRFMPIGYLRIDLWSENGGRMAEILLRLDGRDGGRPWLVEYAVQKPLPEELENAPAQNRNIPYFDAPAPARAG